MLNRLNEYHEKGLVYKQVHPTLPLTIWNYSPICQYEGAWDEITLQCRGLVTDDQGNVIARPFKKFFNMEEGRHTPTKDFEVYDKLDGSLGILFFYQDQWILATRGSFTSEQSVEAFKMLQKYDYGKLHKKYTYLFEIIYIENRIVCVYPYEDLVLLGIVDTKTGYEVDLYNEGVDVSLKNIIKNVGFRIAKKYDGIQDYSVLKSMIGDNEEGYVIRFSNGDRVKIKGEEYLRLHKLMTNVSTTSIWEIMSSNSSMDELLNNVPDEFYQKIKEYSISLKHEYNKIIDYCERAFDYFINAKSNNIELEPTKKDFANFVMKNIYSPYRSVMFALWDKKGYEHIVWNIIKPEWKKL